MGQLHTIQRFGQFEDPDTLHQQEVLERAVAKLVLIGERVGVSAGQMIHLLESGLTMSELLGYLAVRNNEVV